jgi:hypothetical protein
MKRRSFIQLSAFAGYSLSLSSATLFNSCTPNEKHSEEYRQLIFGLLKEWCDGMMNVQVINPSDSKVHGMLECPACDHIHARLMDAVYPFLFMAKATGDQKYLEAGIALFEWGDNVSRADGAWTNELDPKSWDGITVFGAISLAEALKYHGDLLDEERRNKWMDRLGMAADFIYKRFEKVDKSNINYGATAMYAFNLIGKMLNKPEYLKRSKEFASQIKSHFTEPNGFLFGEIQEDKRRLSTKGLYGIDLGYNVEESLNGLVLYALHENDEELLQLLEKSLNTHLEFIIPDGGLDNSFGTRMFKWTYWGSRTSDGMQQAFGMMAHYNSAFGTATFKNTELLKQCTKDGLLHGGPHYVSHGVKPCVHHTFAHAKPLASMLDNWNDLPEINKSTPLPRAIADGIKYYQEIDTSLFARGEWRGTVTGYDAEYSLKEDIRQATGGALSLLFHNKVGLLCVASMAVYKMKEAYNQQPSPGKDIALTPRIETFKDETWYTNLFDLSATFISSDSNNVIEHTANVQLKSEARDVVSETASNFILNYLCSDQKIKIVARTDQKIKQKTAFVLPIVSPNGEIVNQIATNEITIKKPGGIVKISSNVSLKIKEMSGSRTFNMVPGVEAIPIVADFPEGQKLVEISIEII